MSTYKLFSFYIYYIIMAKVRVCIAPRLVKYELLKEFQENKKQTFPSDYLAIYQKSDKQDDS